MMKWSSLAALIVGICIGWMGRGFVVQSVEENTINDTLNAQEIGNSPLVESRNHLAESSEGKRSSLVTLSEQKKSEQAKAKGQTAKERLLELLHANQFQQAVALVYDTSQLSEVQGKQLREEIIAYLKKLDAAKNDVLFVDLINAYLGVFYQDIQVLLLLADFNANHHYYNEAIGVFQLAQEYAFELNDGQEVEVAFNAFIQRVDQHLVSQSDWLNLAIVYESADLVGLLNNEQKLRQADVYVSNGDLVLARSLLQSLVATPLGDAASERLKALNDSDNQSERFEKDLTNSAAYGAPIQKRGNQYVTQLTLGEQDTVGLLIDTGASMTTISQEVFDRLSWDTYHTYQGSRMFNTANGMTRGSVYVLETVTLGGYSLKNHQVAVMDFSIDDTVVGLLGMNTLTLFEFQFDENQGMLRLTPRRK